MIIERVYKDYSPDKISNVPSILEKYKGKNAELLSKISEKYKLHLEDYISIDYLRLVKEILTKHDPGNVSTASSLLASYTGREKELLKSLSEKFKSNFNDLIILIYLSGFSLQYLPQENPSIVSEKIPVPSQEHVLYPNAIPAGKGSKKLLIGIIAVGLIILVAIVLYFSGVFNSSKPANSIGPNSTSSGTIGESSHSIDKTSNNTQKKTSNVTLNPKSKATTSNSKGKVSSKSLNSGTTNSNNGTVVTKAYTGNVGKLGASYNLTWNSDGTIEGTYYYPQRSNITYILKGKDFKNGTIQLTEYTGNNITAICNLSLHGNCYLGEMKNTDGRILKMTICQDNKIESSGDQLSTSSQGRFPFTATRLVDISDLSGLSKQDLKIMRNEIFARHGFIFKTPEMKAYFTAQSWYHGQYDDVVLMLSNIEKQNVILIKKYE